MRPYRSGRFGTVNFALHVSSFRLQVTLILFGWGLAQYPYLVTPDLTFSNTAAPNTVLRPLLIVLIAGGLLVPAFWYLYTVFKGAARKAGETEEEVRT